MPTHSLSDRLSLARTLAGKVGREAEAFRRGADADALAVASKGPQDFVTVADRRAEEAIRAELARTFPDDGFMGEETGGDVTRPGFWVVDPIDGTSNYIRGLRHWGVSIAYVEGGEIRLGCIFDATSGSVYSATLGGGAFRDGKPIRAAVLDDPTRALAILGYSRRTDFAAYQSVTRALYDLGIEYRRLGAASIGLIRVAAGVADLYFEAHLNAWDVLAGVLIASEAGAVVDMPPLPQMLRAGGPVAVCTTGLKDKLSFLPTGA